jgi:riboflavin kinase / FMN adenylyltransferase
MVLTRRVDGIANLGSSATPRLVALGNFDGVHIGHRSVIEASRREARERGLDPLLLTFHPHPSEVLGRGTLPVLTTIERKVELICRVAPEFRVVVEPFTLELSRVSPRDFASQFLVQGLSARVVIVGDNFRFGHARSGDLHTLVELGRELGFEAHASALTGDEAGPYSSTRVRAALSAGDLATVERLLGRPHALTGTVVRGDGRGRSIGVPTANLGGVLEALPPNGVFACLVDRVTPEGAVVLGRAVANVGVRPTLSAGFSIEAHVFDFDADLYGATLRLHFVQFLREERRFSGLEALTQQIQRDLGEARQVLGGRVPDPAAGGAWY